MKQTLDFISVNNALDELDCSRFFLYKLVKEKRLTKQKIGKKTYFLRSELNALIQRENA